MVPRAPGNYEPSFTTDNTDAICNSNSRRHNRTWHQRSEKTVALGVSNSASGSSPQRATSFEVTLRPCSLRASCIGFIAKSLRWPLSNLIPFAANAGEPAGSTSRHTKGSKRGDTDLIKAVAERILFSSWTHRRVRTLHEHQDARIPEQNKSMWASTTRWLNHKPIFTETTIWICFKYQSPSYPQTVADHSGHCQSGSCVAWDNTRFLKPK